MNVHIYYKCLQVVSVQMHCRNVFQFHMANTVTMCIPVCTHVSTCGHKHSGILQVSYFSVKTVVHLTLCHLPSL